MKNNVSKLHKNECCGCKMCANSCPKHCISYKEDSEGFYYPEVYDALCIDCGRCVKLCPEINSLNYSSVSEAVACYATDEVAQFKGSSGGVFGILAREVLVRSGKVWGAAFDDKMKLRHTFVEDYENLSPLLKSKYLQSNCENVYSQIKADLQLGRNTLFCGTPCQCNALRNFVGPNLLEKLILVDFICHGVPSQNLFDKMINWLEGQENGKIYNFTFRYKGEKHLQAYSYNVIKNGKVKKRTGLHYQNPFYFGFQKHITLRPSCFQCKWSKTERCSDITLGDFWGIEKYSDLPKEKGVSMVLLNTEKGRVFFEDVCSRELLVTELHPINHASDNNGCMVAPTKEPKQRTQFFTDLANCDFNYVVNRYLKSRRQYVFDIYYAIPGFLRKIVRKIMDKHMRYE